MIVKGLLLQSLQENFDSCNLLHHQAMITPRTDQGAFFGHMGAQVSYPQSRANFVSRAKPQTTIIVFIWGSGGNL
jgi:hypothetical protein